MPPKRPTKPLVTKTQVVAEIIAAVEKRGMTAAQAVEWLSSYFTTIDLIGIRDDITTLNDYLENHNVKT